MKKNGITTLGLCALLVMAIISCNNPKSRTPSPTIQPEKVQSSAEIEAANENYRYWEALDSTKLSYAHPELYAELLHGDSILATGDTMAAIMIWRDLGIAHINTYINRESLRRLEPTPILKYMMDHPPVHSDW